MMKYCIAFSLFFLPVFCAYSQQGSQWAGEDVTICPSIGDTLGIKTDPCPDCCYEWTPQEGLSCTDCKNPVVKVETNQTFSVKVTDAFLRWQETDQVDVSIGFGPIEFSPTYLQQGRADEKVTASLIENVDNVPINWTIEGDSLGCTIQAIDQYTAEITPGNKYGKITIRATDASDLSPPLCYIEKEIEINEGIKDIEVTDLTNQGRVAKQGDTLWLFGDKSAQVRAVPNDEGFLPDQPIWRDDAYLQCNTPEQGARLFNTPPAGFLEGTLCDTETLIAGSGPDFKPQVTIIRGSLIEQEFPLPSFTALDEAEQTLKKFKFKNIPFELNIESDVGQTKYKETEVEKFNDPGKGLKKEWTFGANLNISGKILHPVYSKSGTIPFTMVGFETELYIQGGLGAEIAGGIVYDPSASANPSWTESANLKVTFSGCAAVGFGAMVTVPNAFEIKGGFELESCIKCDLIPKFSESKINQQWTWEPATAKLILEFEDLSNMENVFVFPPEFVPALRIIEPFTGPETLFLSLQ